MVVQTFEKILNNPVKMAYYKKSSILEATFMAMYAYKKAGHNFDALPWFSLSKTERKAAKQAA
jgi:hypothetical protein